jgi:hypothetical protein
VICISRSVASDEELPVAVLDKDIRKDGQRVPTFDDTRDSLERAQQCVAGELF